MINSDNVIYFLAGACLPTIAFLLLGQRDAAKKPSIELLHDLRLQDGESGNDDEEDENDENFLATAQLLSKVDPKSWGMKDAPYKVSLPLFRFQCF